MTYSLKPKACAQTGLAFETLEIEKFMCRYGVLVYYECQQDGIIAFEHSIRVS
jgi:hypothetical protein